ncbi:cysteine hydrolase [Nocardia sp. NPDC060256]|uniref:cysteine hydrolase n=1 Tax=unclassified Nocardia TaxID=2637762 RepID=UPI0036586AAE
MRESKHRAERTLLLSMDFQLGLLEQLPTAAADAAVTTRLVLSAARRAGIQVGHVVAGFRPGYPELAPWNTAFAGIAEAGRLVAGGPDTAIHPALAPVGPEFVITKSRVSAFGATDLDRILRSREITTLVLVGVATSGVVLATLLDAFDRDYRVVVLRDCTADADKQIHHALTERIFPRYSRVLYSDEFVLELEAGFAEM